MVCHFSGVPNHAHPSTPHSPGQVFHDHIHPTWNRITSPPSLLTYSDAQGDGLEIIQLEQCYMYRSNFPRISHHGGFELFPSLLEGLNPRISPTIPPGFGIGHSPLFDFDNWSRRVLALLSSINGSSFNISASPSFSTTFARLLLLRVPSGISPSAYATLGAGHGRICGKATTKKLAKSVVANIEEVARLRGCKCGGMLAALERASR